MNSIKSIISIKTVPRICPWKFPGFSNIFMSIHNSVQYKTSFVGNNQHIIGIEPNQKSFDFPTINWLKTCVSFRSCPLVRSRFEFQVGHKFIHPKKYSKHWPYSVAYTIDCVCSRMLNDGLNHGLFLSLFKLIPCPIHWIAYVLAYLNFIFEF